MIPYDDILLFLAANERQCSETKEFNYKYVSLMLETNQAEFAPLSITDYLLARNVQKSGIELPSLSYSYIEGSTPDELTYLVEQLDITIYNKERIIRILNYLGLLIKDEDDKENDNVELLPLNIGHFQIFTYESLYSLYKWMDYKVIIRTAMVSKWFCKYYEYLKSSPLYQEILESSIKYGFLDRRIRLDLTGYNKDELLQLARVQYTDTNIIIEHICEEVSRDVGIYKYNKYKLIHNQLLYKCTEYLNGVLKNNYDTVLINDASNIINIVSFGPNSAVMLMNNGKVYSINNQTSLIDLITTRDKIIQIAGVNCRVLMITGNNKLYMLNSSPYMSNSNFRRPRELEIGDIKGKLLQVAVGHKFSVVLTDQGYLYGIGERNSFELIYPYKYKSQNFIASVVKVTITDDSILILNTKGQVYMIYDDNKVRQLGKVMH